MPHAPPRMRQKGRHSKLLTLLWLVFLLVPAAIAPTVGQGVDSEVISAVDTAALIAFDVPLMKEAAPSDGHTIYKTTELDTGGDHTGNCPDGKAPKYYTSPRSAELTKQARQEKGKDAAVFAGLFAAASIISGLIFFYARSTEQVDVTFLRISLDLFVVNAIAAILQAIRSIVYYKQHAGTGTRAADLMSLSVGSLFAGMWGFWCSGALVDTNIWTEYGELTTKWYALQTAAYALATSGVVSAIEFVFLTGNVEFDEDHDTYDNIKVVGGLLLVCVTIYGLVKATYVQGKENLKSKNDEHYAWDLFCDVGIRFGTTSVVTWLARILFYFIWVKAKWNCSSSSNALFYCGVIAPFFPLFYEPADLNCIGEDDCHDYTEDAASSKVQFVSVFWYDINFLLFTVITLARLFKFRRERAARHHHEEFEMELLNRERDEQQDEQEENQERPAGASIPVRRPPRSRSDADANPGDQV